MVVLSIGVTYDPHSSADSHTTCGWANELRNVMGGLSEARAHKRERSANLAAARDDARHAAALRNVAQLADSHGCRLHDVPGDGQCLFHALLHALQHQAGLISAEKTLSSDCIMYCLLADVCFYD